MTIPDEDELFDRLVDLFDAEQNIDPLERSRRIALLSDRLRNCLGEADALGLSEAGSHVDMALHAIGKVREPKGQDFSPSASRLH
ncbi:hypothetical protein [Sphingomonas sp.]|uniref:hypothetical protein n=1 Tax=Sphingomonas sp. TaxID=28214 RepID=UPI00307EA3A3